MKPAGEGNRGKTPVFFPYESSISLPGKKRPSSKSERKSPWGGGAKDPAVKEYD